MIYVLISTKHIFRCRKLNIYLVCITQYYLSVPKNVRLNSARYLIMKIKNKRELQNIAIKHSAEIHYKDFTKILRKCTAEPHSFLIDYTTLPADNPLHFLKKCFITIIKMTLTDEIKILEDKIKANQTQYN